MARINKLINKLVVIGVGLIGGSLALDLRRAGQVGTVTGVGRSAANLAEALQLSVIDHASHDAAAAVEDADFVLLATPVGQMGAVMAALAPVLPAHALVCDAGSTKGDVQALFRRHLPGHLARCVPAHPIAGSDLSGAAAARTGLFEGRNVVLTPLPESAPDSIRQVEAVWQACGAHTRIMSAEAHDAVFATVSHLPHLLAFAYMDFVAGKADADTCLQLAASGFRDFTRIAGSHPEMWRDITLANRDCLLADLEGFRTTLDTLISHVRERDSEGLQSLFSEASRLRSQWPGG